MLNIRQRLDQAQQADAALQLRLPPTLTLTLPFDLRQKSRLKARLDNGTDAALVLPRGTILRDGDLLLGDNGVLVEVKAAPEQVSTVRAEDPVLLARAAYHLGNRHVQLQIGSGWLRYQHDHVLDAMLRRMDFSVSVENAGFEPEAGAYGHNHAHEHEHE